MNPTSTPDGETSNRSKLFLWVAALLLLIALVLFPVSTRITRTGGLALFFIVWIGLIYLCWHRRARRIVLLIATLLAAGFLALPARKLPDAESLRQDYVAGLRRYNGVTYYWGGESPVGIDCSGLIRRGLVDSLFLRGVRTFDPGLVRSALSLWWNDCTARVLGEARDGLTIHLQNAPSLNKLDHSDLLPGDLAVTTSGVHIFAYLGDRHWIEADPGLERVITVRVPTTENFWFEGPVNIVRWNLLSN